MATSPPPLIFSDVRRAALLRRMRALQNAPNAPGYLIEDMVEDVLERLAFLRHEPKKVLIVGDWTGQLEKAPQLRNCIITSAYPAPTASNHPFNEEQPYPFGGFDLIASLGTLDTVNDLPGALIHLRNALAPGGLMITSFIGAGSLPNLRTAMLAADGDRPAARMHPMVDVRSGGQLLQRTGFANPVVDSRVLKVRFGSLGGLVRDLRAQGLTNVLASSPPPLNRAMARRAEQSFQAAGDAENRITERFDILTLSGWKPVDTRV